MGTPSEGGDPAIGRGSAASAPLGAADPVSQKYELVFSIFLLLVAFLWRENSALVYPQSLYLLAAFLGLNYGAGVSLRRWPRWPELAAFAILANCAVITSLLENSGGPDSNLWVLYLLPIYTTALLLGPRELVWITAGALSFNLAYHLLSVEHWQADLYFALLVKSGILLFGAVATWRLVRRERASRARLRDQAERLDRLAQNLESQSEQLERTEAVAQMGWTTAGVAHDLGAPLGIITAVADLLLEDPSGMDLRQELQRIQRAAEICREMVLGLSGNLRGGEFRLAENDLNEIAESSLSLCERSLQRRGVRVERDLAPSLPNVHASRTHVVRMVLNLINNSVAAMGGEGTVTVRTALVPGRPGQKTREVDLIVEDTGPGIAPEVLPKLFKPFVTTKAGKGGAGIGLNLCRKIAQRHGGDLRGENRSEGGARFVLTLPAVEGAGARGE